MSRMDTNDVELVEQARTGNPDAFRALVDRHSRTLFHTAYRLTGNEQNAEDIVQEALLKAFRKLDKFDRRAEFGTWLYRITVNTAMDLMRKEKRRTAKAPMEGGLEMETFASTEPAPDRVALSGETGRAVARVLAGLSPLERSAFVLRHFEGRTTAEICQTLGIRTGATKQAVFRAVRKLRTALEPMLQPGDLDGQALEDGS
jgi:RNA polymerase sigma-70 factor (ECF subfamily)